MGRSPCCAKEGLNRGAWTAIEDKILTDYINANGEGKWRNLPKKAGLKRCGKSCRLRWLNYLRPDIKRGNISADEEELIIRLHKLLGNRWSLIAGRLPGRTDNEIKNYWNTNLGKKVQDPQISNKQQEKKADITSSAASFVIRTKATKCSRVVLDREFHKPQQPNHCHTHTETTPSKDVHGGLLSRDNPVGSLFPIEENNDNSSQDFGMDFNLGELNGLSELLDTEFSDFFKFNSELSSSGNELPPMFSKEELLQNWTAQPFVASNFNPFASLLDSAGDWLGESN